MGSILTGGFRLPAAELLASGRTWKVLLMASTWNRCNGKNANYSKEVNNSSNMQDSDSRKVDVTQMERDREDIRAEADCRASV